MKLIFTVLLSLISSFSIGQYQTPFPDSLATWRFQNWQYADPGDPNSQTSYSSVTLHARDTIYMNGHFYSRLFADGSEFIYTPENCLYDGNLVGYHRIEGDKVFYIKEPTADWADWAYFDGADYQVELYSYYNFNTEDEILLYDFGLTVGDSFAITKYDTIIVESIDSVLINNYMYKRLNFDVSLCGPSNLPDDYHWIEGIGSSFGYFPYADCFESGGKALCFHEYFYTGLFAYPDSTSSYEPENGYCWILQLGQDDLSLEPNFIASPNPVVDLLHLEFIDEQNSIQISNSTGEIMDQFISNGYSLIYDLSEFSQGVYFVRVNNHVQRIVKN